MIVLPDGKVCRNLPEQVAENLKKIQEIIHYLDGVNIQDNLVVIADLSQILTQAELEIVERPVAFIYYNDELFIKKNEDSGNAYFDNVFSLTASGTQIDFASNEIAVVLATGALSLVSATATTYPKSQIDTLLAAKANDSEVAKLSGAAFTGAITSPSIIEDMSGYSFSGTYTGTTYEILITYAGAVKTGNKLTLVAAFTVKRISNTIDNYFPTIGLFTVPTSIFNKLYPAVGQLLDAKQIALVINGADTTPVIKTAQINKYTSTVAFVLGRPQDLTLDQLYYGRIEATFLLSDNLAA